MRSEGEVSDTKQFYQFVISLSNTRSQREAYSLAEVWHRRKYGSRRYKNYDVFKATMSRLRKNGKQNGKHEL